MGDDFRRELLGEWNPIDPAAVLGVMPLGVDLDLAQVASRAELLPRDAQRALDYFVEVGCVVKVNAPNMSRVRYKRMPR